MNVRLINIEWGDGQRVRRVVSRSNYRVTGKHPSWKRGGMAYWESPLERDAFRRLDGDSSVLNYEEQPAKITYSIDGKTHTHYPDVLVSWRTRKGFLEIKTDRNADEDEIRERTDIMCRLLPGTGYSYGLWRESEIRIQPRLANDIFLLRFGRQLVPAVGRERVRRLFQEMSSIPWGVLAKQLLGPDGLSYAARLTLEGVLLVNRDVPISAASLVRFNDANGSET